MSQAATWAFTPPQAGAAACVASWDGAHTLTDTVAATGAPLATYSGQSLARLAAPLTHFASGSPAGRGAAYATLGNGVTSIGGQAGALTLAQIGAAGLQAASVNFKPANPAATVSTTLVMMGLGATCVFTPSGTGKVRVDITGQLGQATAAAFDTVAARYGTGTAPVNGAAVVGTRFGGGQDAVERPSSFSGASTAVPVGFTDDLALTPGTAYWFDLALLTGSGSDSVYLQNISVTIEELPS